MIDLFSDTHTVPDEGMRRAMAAAEVGDSQMGEDAATRRLAERVAALFDKEAALFLPTGSMCNKVAIAALTSMKPFARICWYGPSEGPAVTQATNAIWIPAMAAKPSQRRSPAPAGAVLNGVFILLIAC